MMNSACEKKCEGGCTTNFVCEKGTCICPDNKIEIGDDCRILGDNEFYGEAMGEDCNLCDFDQMIIGILYDGINVNGTLFNGENSTSFGYPTIEYFELSDGDSIHLGRFDWDLTPPTCTYNNKLIMMEGKGKFSLDKSKLNLTFTYFTERDSTPIGNCSFVFTR